MKPDDLALLPAMLKLPLCMTLSWTSATSDSWLVDTLKSFSSLMKSSALFTRTVGSETPPIDHQISLKITRGQLHIQGTGWPEITALKCNYQNPFYCQCNSPISLQWSLNFYLICHITHICVICWNPLYSFINSFSRPILWISYLRPSSNQASLY